MTVLNITTGVFTAGIDGVWTVSFSMRFLFELIYNTHLSLDQACRTELRTMPTCI